METSDFEVMPVGTGRQLAELSDIICDMARDIRAVLQSANLSTTQKFALRAALARAGQPIKL